jgi:predicted nucleic acid-binding protein
MSAGRLPPIPHSGSAGISATTRNFWLDLQSQYDLALEARTARRRGLNLPIDVDTHEAALHLAKQQGFAMFDALMIATALQAGSTTLWSEDMQHGMLVDRKLRIANPFRATD